MEYNRPVNSFDSAIGGIRAMTDYGRGCRDTAILILLIITLILVKEGWEYLYSKTEGLQAQINQAKGE